MYNKLNFFLERRSQNQVPLQEGTTAVRRAQRRGDRGQRLHHQGALGEIQQRSRCRFVAILIYQAFNFYLVKNVLSICIYRFIF